MSDVSVSRVTSNSLLPECKKRSNWICWSEHRNPTKNEKVPVDPREYVNSRGMFKSTQYHNRAIWMSYGNAKQYADEHDEISGIGFVVFDSPFSYIDLDNCVDPDTLEIASEALEIVHEANSYAELSYSGTGLHIVCRGPTPKYGWSRPDDPLQVGLFDGSWVAITENHIEGTPFKARRAKECVTKICDEYDIDTHEGW